ncbi:MAG: TldD/PmbA family protein [Ignavibacteria bacterium]|nr:TldD/PmbA family protein [Ignavibacteria bacterium]
MLLNEKEAKEIIERILNLSKADSAVVSVRGSNTSNIRFAANTVTTTGSGDSIQISITSNIGKKSGSSEITSLDGERIEEGVRVSELSATLSQDNEEFMPPVGSGLAYRESKEYFESTAGMSPAEMAGRTSSALETSIGHGLTAAGYFEADKAFSAIGNSNGLFAFHKNTFARFASTMRTAEGTGSSKMDRSYADINRLDVRGISGKIADRAKMSGNPQRLEPGKYIAVLDHAASCDMVNGLLNFMSMRSADEGRSYFSENGSNKIGRKLFSEIVSIESDPSDSDAPARPFTEEGYPVDKTVWVKDGVLENLYTSRYWAKKTGKTHNPHPTNLIMKGTDSSVEDLIASTERGVFVTRFWYIRVVDRKQMLLTGLTRDGVFLIENGKITYPVNNFRFNESPANVLQNVVDMSSAEKAVGSENVNSRIVVPALKVKDFNFSTISEAV